MPFVWGLRALIFAALLAILGGLLGNLIGMDLVIVASILLTMCWNFVLDRKLAFWWAREGRAGLQLLGFIAVCAVPVLVNFWITRTFATEDQMATPLAGVIGASIGSAWHSVQLGCEPVLRLQPRRRA